MTIPQDLAGRLEKAHATWKSSNGLTAYNALDDIVMLVIGQGFDTILASLRRSAPASGEMGEALRPFAEAAKNAEISGRPPSEFVDAGAYELARSILERETQ